MHQRIETLLNQVNNNISVQYILSSFGENLNSTNKFLIAACLKDKKHTLHSQQSEFSIQKTHSQRVFCDWFEKGKPLRDDYFKDMGLDMENPDIEVEFEKHETWKQKSQLNATPTVLVNGYLLPEIYKIEDFRYFTKLDL